MIQSTYKIDRVDKQFLNSIYSLSKRGLDIHFTVDVETGPYFGKEYGLPPSRLATLHVTTYTTQDRDDFDSWLEKENFRLALKGMSVIQWDSESYSP